MTRRDARPHLLLNSSRNVSPPILVLPRALCFLFHQLGDLLTRAQVIFKFDGQYLVIFYQRQLLAQKVVLLRAQLLVALVQIVAAVVQLVVVSG